MANKKKVFISFDYGNDSALKTLLLGQSKNEDDRVPGRGVRAVSFGSVGLLLS